MPGACLKTSKSFASCPEKPQKAVYRKQKLYRKKTQNQKSSINYDPTKSISPVQARASPHLKQHSMLSLLEYSFSFLQQFKDKIK